MDYLTEINLNYYPLNARCILFDIKQTFAWPLITSAYICYLQALIQLGIFLLSIACKH